MAVPVSGFILPIMMVNGAGLELPVDVTNGLSVSLATKIAGEDLTNDWMKTQLTAVNLTKITTASLFSSATVAGGATNNGIWIDISNYSRWCVWAVLNQTYTLFINGRPIGMSGLQKTIHASSAGVAANTVTILSNTRYSVDNSILCDELELRMDNTSGSSGTIQAALFLAP